MKLEQISRGFMLRAAIGAMGRRQRQKHPLWGLVKIICGVGSTSAHEICRELGWNPEASGHHLLPPEKPEEENPWVAAMPAVEGIYDFQCNETGDDIQMVKVFLLGVELWCEDPNIGKNPLAHFHENLMEPRWRFVSKL